MNQYPRDEFDAVPERSPREGAHRSFLHVTDPRRGIWALVICGVLALIVGACMYFLVRPLGEAAATQDSASETSSAQASASGSAEASGQASPTAAASSDAAASGDAASTAPSSDAATSTAPSSDAASSDAASSDAASSDAADVNTALPVGVYNGTTRSGLAVGAAATLRSGGFASVNTGNWTRSATTSTVYYKDASSEATARKIASSLGISTVYRTSNIPAQISVVLGADR